MQTRQILETKNISKKYPGSLALDGVDYRAYEGKVNVLIGENGAGKSTLMKIIAGVETPTGGEIFFEGQNVKYATPLEAEQHGIGIIYQELNLFPNMSVAENIFIAHEKMGAGPLPSVDHAGQEKLTIEMMTRLEQDISPRSLVGDLRVGQQQVVEIAKALSHNTKVLIMDEPTSALSVQEVEVLFKVMQDLKSRGVTIIYISHRLEEIIRIGDHITILRDGHLVAEEFVKNIDIPWIIEQMTGETNLEMTPTEHEIGEVLLEVGNLSLPNRSGGFKVDDVSFRLHKGEILGVYGLMGAGRTELLECLIGANDDYDGTISVCDCEVRSKDINGRIADGFSLIPEDRKHQGLVLSLPVRDNMTLSNLKSYVSGVLSRISSKNEQKDVNSMIDKLAIKVAGMMRVVSSLSGGNQQKVVIGKSLLTNPKILLMDEPTRGIDVGAKRDVFNIIKSLSKEGLGVILVSSELKEMTTIPDRVIVLSNGKMTEDLRREDITQEKLVRASAAKQKG